MAATRASGVSPKRAARRLARRSFRVRMPASSSPSMEARSGAIWSAEGLRAMESSAASRPAGFGSISWNVTSAEAISRRTPPFGRISSVSPRAAVPTGSPVEMSRRVRTPPSSSV